MSGSLYESFDNGEGALSNDYNVDYSTPGEVRLAGNSAMMEYATGPSAGHGYGTHTIEAKLDGSEPGPAIIFWPGDNQWPGQELDLAEITPDGSGRQYGTVHWNNNGSDAYEAQVYDGDSGGVFHDYTMVWESGKITYLVDGAVRATFTDNVPTDYANGGMNNTIGFLNNNPDTAITVRDVNYVPLGNSAPAPAPEEVVVPGGDDRDEAEEEMTSGGGDSYKWQAPSYEPEPETAGISVSVEGPWAEFTLPSGEIDWEAAAADVTANYEQTGYWFV